MCRIISPHPYKTFLFLFCVEHIHKFRIGSEDCPNSKIHLFLVRLFSLTISHFVAVRNLFHGRTIYFVSSHSPRPISPIAKVLLSDAIFRLSEKSEKITKSKCQENHRNKVIFSVTPAAIFSFYHTG